MVRKQNENNLVWFFAILSMLVLFGLRCFNDQIAMEPDATFLYNRCFQMWDCIKHGEWPFLYYNDLGGIGYGSPIFYGQLTLVPFIPFLANISVFLKVYFLCSLLLNFFAFRLCAKRFSSYATLSACFYIIGLPFVCFYAGTGLYAGATATGFSWLFFAYCIDYFRDGKNLILLILTYFLTWQSNLNSVILATIVCFCLFLVYFDKSRFKDYVKLFVCVLFLVLFDIVNILTHLDALCLTDSALLFPDELSLPDFVLSSYPFGGFLFRIIANSNGFSFADVCVGFLQFGVVVVLCYFFIRGWKSESKRFKVCSAVVFISAAVLYVVGQHFVWYNVYKATDLFIQFPIRYLILFWGAIVILLSRVIYRNLLVYIVLGVCILDVFITNPVKVHQPNGNDIYYLSYSVVNGEYLGKTFIFDRNLFEDYSSSVHALSGVEYAYENTYNGVVVDCSSNTGDDVLTLPKLYYRWYVAVGDSDEQFEVKSGYSNFCSIDIGSYTGSLRLRYQVPFAILILCVLQIGCFVSLSYFAIRDCYIDWRSKRVKAE